MRRPFLLLPLCCLMAAGGPAHAAEGRVIKVIPQLLDLQGRHALSPSLYERDAYQAYLRKHANLVSGVRFYLQWKATGGAYAPLRLRVELRGTAQGDLPSTAVLETAVQTSRWFGRWTSLTLKGDDYKKFGQRTAWRVTLWEGDRQLGEQRSFLW